MAKKEKRVIHRFTSPTAPAKYPSLTKPDFGTTEYPCPQGRYKTGLVMKADDPATKAFIAKLTPLYNEAIEKGREEFAKLKVEVRKKLKDITINDLFVTLYDSETEEPTGYIEFRFKADASGVANKGKDNERPWKFKPQYFDSKGRELVNDIPDIWGGSELKVAFEANPYFVNGTGACGLSLKLKAVQIIELRSGDAKSASDYGFGAEEDGYEYQSDAERSGFSSAEEDTGAEELETDEGGHEQF